MAKSGWGPIGVYEHLSARKMGLDFHRAKSECVHSCADRVKVLRFYQRAGDLKMALFVLKKEVSPCFRRGRRGRKMGFLPGPVSVQASGGEFEGWSAIWRRVARRRFAGRRYWGSNRRGFWRNRPRGRFGGGPIGVYEHLSARKMGLDFHRAKSECFHSCADRVTVLRFYQ